MEKSGNKIIAIIALLVGVAGLSVGFAALSTNLTINGTGTVKKSTWDIHFANLGTIAKTGTATEVAAPTLTATKVGDYEVQLMTPGDSISYTFDIANTGDYDAKISTITVPTPNCVGTGTDATTDASNVCDNLVYTLKYTDDGADVKANDTLDKGVTKNVTLTLTYKASVTSDLLPKNDVSISNLSIPIVYVQK